MIDKYNRNITYARLSITDKCNLKCKYCRPSEEKIITEKNLSFQDMYKIARALSEIGIKKLRLTGGEPLVVEGVENFIKKLKDDKLFEEICITTNGTNLKEKAEILKKSGLDLINISLDTLDKEQYKEITGGEIDKVLDGIKEAIKNNFKSIKINAVLIKNFNENQIEELANLTLKHNIDVRFIELMEIGESCIWTKGKYLSGQTVIDKLSSLKPENNQENSVATYYKLPDAKGRIGLIQAKGNSFCDKCNRIRIDSYGYMRPCLHSEETINLLDSINDHDKLKEKIQLGIMKKPEKHRLLEGIINNDNMTRIGG